MFGKFRRNGSKKPIHSKTEQEQAEPQQDDAQFYQAVINKFVAMIDEYAASDPGIPGFRERWKFSLSDLEAWNQTETAARMSCRITATDVQGVFPQFSEWVHGFGGTMDEAFAQGFSSWITTDLPVLIDVIQEKAVLSLEVSFENETTRQTVRGILGPMQLWTLADNSADFCCNSCILSQALIATGGELKARQTPYLIKAVVARNPDNTTTCDFRINGEQDEGIASALSQWAATWEGEGFVMRKQSLLFV